MATKPRKPVGCYRCPRCRREWVLPLHWRFHICEPCSTAVVVPLELVGPAPGPDGVPD